MQALGIDIGGSGIKGALVETHSGKLIGERYRLDTPDPATPELILPLLQSIIEEFQHQGPIGCGFPGVIRHNIIYTAANLNEAWIGIDLSKLLKKATGCPTYILNDADAAGLAEITWGAGKNKPGTMLMVTVGTGLGTALFKDGVLYPNLEMGRILLKNGHKAEKWVSGAIRKKEDLSWKSWTKRLNEYLQLMEAYLQPDFIIIGGGISKKADHFLPLLKLKAPVMPAKLGNQAGIIGAAAYALTEVGKI